MKICVYGVKAFVKRGDVTADPPKNPPTQNGDFKGYFFDFENVEQTFGNFWKFYTIFEK